MCVAEDLYYSNIVCNIPTIIIVRVKNGTSNVEAIDGLLVISYFLDFMYEQCRQCGKLHGIGTIIQRLCRESLQVGYYKIINFNIRIFCYYKQLYWIIPLNVCITTASETALISQSPKDKIGKYTYCPKCIFTQHFEASCWHCVITYYHSLVHTVL